ncbi:unnamed protein product [Peronospora farinosa]|uniref:K Homology domain-containing protein n=1 Tax=Peronospora farinosa TaxID=134698 RepID=A0AAV0TYM1_9STRA|nr:unnamed protein product [Peronospora farinosa]CAI5728992.1 unnamed protein product [Peronospora farinosa]
MTLLQNDESVAIQSETHSGVLSLIPKRQIADLTGSPRAQISRLQELIPLEVPRNVIVDQLQQKTQVKKQIGNRQVPVQSQVKQGRKNAFSLSESIELMKKLKLVTPDEYEDAELHGDFKHVMYILIPSNATTALLERRGQPIQTISQQTGCTLSVREPDASPFKDDRLLRIYGKPKCISLAQRLVIAYIRVFRAEKKDPIYMDLSDETLPIALPATSITKAMSVAVTAGKKSEVEITNPFRWMVQREDVGKMMGRQGCILASIRRDTGASIRIEDDVVPGTTERRVTLSGSVESIAAAVERIKSKSNGRPEEAASVVNGGHGQYFAIPYYAAGCLIGPQGSTIKNITERTGARLQIPSAEDLPLGSINRILHVQGTSKQTEHAQRIVRAKLRDFLVSSTNPKSLSLSSTGLKGDKVTIKVLLSSRICGFMLDQRGKLIREISKKSGAHTHFLASHNDGNRVCVFTGDMSCVLRAQRLVLQVIAGDVISSKRNRKRKRLHRDEEKVEENDKLVDDKLVEEDMKDENPYYEGDVEEETCYGDEEKDALGCPVRRRNERRQPNRRLRHEYEENEEDMYIYDDSTEYEVRPRQPIRRQPVVVRSRGYFEDESGVDDYILDEYDRNERIMYDVPRSRPSMRPIVVRRQPATRPRDEYDDEEDDDEYGYEDDSDGLYENAIVGKQVVERRPIGIRQRRPIACLGRKVQMVAPNSRPQEERSRTSSTTRRCTDGTGSARLRCRNGSANVRHSVSRGGNGDGRPSTRRRHGNGNTRRQK